MNDNDLCPVPKGTLLIIGGHEAKGTDRNEPFILETFVKLAGGEHAIIEVITTASAEGEESFEPYAELFKKLGASSIGHIHHDERKDALGNEYHERLQAATGVFFSGGDQLKLTSIYGGTPLLMQLKQRYINAPLILGGTSAGAMAMSTPMIYAGTDQDQLTVGNVKIAVGLEFLKDVCVDTHFVDRSRFVRMAQVVATNPTSIGIGIEENTALIVRDGKDCRVIGTGVIIIIEGFKITNSDITEVNRKRTVFIDDLTVRILADGNTYEIPKFDIPHF